MPVPEQFHLPIIRRDKILCISYNHSINGKILGISKRAKTDVMIDQYFVRDRQAEFGCYHYPVLVEFVDMMSKYANGSKRTVSHVGVHQDSSLCLCITVSEGALSQKLFTVTCVCLHQLQFKHWFEHGGAGGSLLLELMPSRLKGIIEHSAPD